MSNAASSPRRTFTCYSFFEARDGLGRVVQFSSERQDTEAITSAIAVTREICPPPRTHLTQTGEGISNYASRYAIHRHRYAGGGSGYIELLEIRDAPDGRHSIVLNSRPAWDRRSFTEWQTVEDGIRAFERSFNYREEEARLETLPGFLRHVDCGMLQPWFCAIGNEDLIRDYAVPYGLEDDPVFRLGAKFVCREFGTGIEIVNVVRTCLGTSRRTDRDFGTSERWVHWDDGSVTRISDRNIQPRPLRESEEWIEDAVSAFRSFLSGATDRFEIPIGQGQSFVGKLKRASTSPTARGEYDIRVHLNGSKEPKRGWVTFTPTPDAPDLVTFLKKKYAEKDVVVDRLEILDTHAVRNGKKWCGVWIEAPSETKLA
jgi:hypothetical protein